MPLAKLKEKGQVTIPASVREQIHATLGDVFDVAVEGGNIVLKPQEVVARKAKRPVAKSAGVDIGRWIGAGKGAFKSANDVDAFMRAERQQWD